MTDPTPEVVKWRQEKIISEAGGEMTMQEFCDEHVRRGWAYPDLTPESMGYEPNTIIKMTNPQKVAALRSH